MCSTWCARRHSYKCVPRSAHVDTPTSNSTWRARGHSLKTQRDELRGTYVVVQIFLHTPTVAIPWRLTHMLLSLDNPKTRPLTLNSVIFFFLHRPTLFHFTSHYFFLIYVSVMARSTIYININKQLNRVKNSFKAPMTKNNSNSRVQSNVHIEKTKHQFLQSTLEHGSGSPLPLTSPRLLAGLLTI